MLGTLERNYSSVVVVCDVNGKVYDDYHFLVQSRKRFKKNAETPNIVVIGLDSVARLYFHSHMPKTVKYLESLGMYEMLGYTKGEN